MARTWYHGDSAKRSSFHDQKMDRDQDRDPNAQGPGIYFTADKEQARGYAHPHGYVYTVDIKTSKIIKDSTRPKDKRTRQEYASAVKMARESGLKVEAVELSELDENSEFRMWTEEELNKLPIGSVLVDTKHRYIVKVDPRPKEQDWHPNKEWCDYDKRRQQPAYQTEYYAAKYVVKVMMSRYQWKLVK